MSQGLLSPSLQPFSRGPSLESPHPLAVRAFVDLLEEQFRQVEREQGSVFRDFCLEGHRFRIRAAGSGVPDQLFPALDHLAQPAAGDSPELVIQVWDGRGSGVALPPSPWPAAQLSLDGNVRGLDSDGIRAAWQADTDSLSLLDADRGVALVRFGDASAMPAYERAAPLKIVLHWWLVRFRLPLIHGAVVGTEAGDGALLVGKTGCGKSTAALACLDSGMRFVTDDRCVLSLGDDPAAVCLYNSAKLWPQQMARFPGFSAAAKDCHCRPDEKALVFVARFAPERLALRMTIRVILLVRIGGGIPTTLTAATPIRVLRDLAPSSLLYQPGAGKDEMAAMAELVRRVPCVGLELGRDLNGISAPVRRAIEAAGGFDGSSR